MYKFLKYYDNPEKFNPKIITGFRKTDKMIDYLVDICKTLETIDNIRFLGYKLITDETQFRVKRYKTIRTSRLSLVILEFKVTYKDEEKLVKMPVFIPKLIHNYYYIIDGNKYYSIYQHVDSSTYNTSKSCILKSLLMPLILSLVESTIVDTNGRVYNTDYFILNLFKHSINILYYYFAQMGLEKTLEFFGYHQFITITDSVSDKSYLTSFEIKPDIYVAVNSELLDNNIHFQRFVCSLVEILKVAKDKDSVYDHNYWKLRLGGFFTTNKIKKNITDKTDALLLSFQRILDNRTRYTLRIDELDKRNIFSLIRWMTINFNNLLYKDNMSLYNKRLRLTEYQVSVFNMKISENTIRILNSKNVTLNQLLTIFKIPHMIIISDLHDSNLRRYHNTVNDLDLFAAALKYSNRGPSTMGEGDKKSIPARYRGINVTHLGKLALNSVSASDPGMSGHICPFTEVEELYYDPESDRKQTIAFRDYIETELVNYRPITEPQI